MMWISVVFVGAATKEKDAFCRRVQSTVVGVLLQHSSTRVIRAVLVFPVEMPVLLTWPQAK
jgi:hypothetical protein